MNLKQLVYFNLVGLVFGYLGARIFFPGMEVAGILVGITVAFIAWFIHLYLEI